MNEVETEVTNYCDWSHASDEMRSGVTWPVVPVEMLEKSVDNLQRIVTNI